MSQLENIEAIERRLWSAADQLRANSNYASNEYFMPVMGLIFLRHAYSRFLNVRERVVPTLPKRGGKTRELCKEDFSQQGAIFLKPVAQFDHLVSLPDSADRAKAIAEAMESIEEDYETLRGVLPKAEYQELDNAVLGQLLRTLNPEELRTATGDIFGRIYEYFLTQFADQGAHDGGEFFTPISLVSLIAHVLEPVKGVVLDPACGSGGMFVQSAHVVEQRHEDPAKRLTFYGTEKNATTIRLAKMNLAVHGLEGDIQKAISYYEDPHELLGKADYVMANPPFNVDEVDAEKIKNDPRLPFGLPGVNKTGKVPNANYLWISYFFSYLNAKGRAGFVMSSQASSAGRDEAKVRQKLVESAAVDIMLAVRPNFFYTRTVPCELWFLDKAKPAAHRDKVLMLDARNIYRKVTRKVYDFSPEQMQNLLAIVWLYRGERERFAQLLLDYRTESELAAAQFHHAMAFCHTANGKAEELGYLTACLNKVACDPALRGLDDETEKSEATAAAIRSLKELIAELKPLPDALREEADLLFTVMEGLRDSLKDGLDSRTDAPAKLAARVQAAVTRMSAADTQMHAFWASLESFHKTLRRGLDIAEKQLGARKMESWKTSWDVPGKVEQFENALERVRDTTHRFHYFRRQLVWLIDRFPDAELRDVPGLVKLVDRREIEASDWSLTPGRYVGVAPPEPDEDFDFEEAMRDIHTELDSLNTEAVALAVKIQANLGRLVG